MKSRDHYLVTHWSGEIWRELDPNGGAYVRQHLLQRTSDVRRMNYELLTVGKVNSTVTGRSSSDEEPIRNFSELLNRFRRYDWLALQSAVVDFYRDLELVD